MNNKLITKLRFPALLALVVAVTHGGAALALPLSFTGNFTEDDDVRLFSFTLARDTDVILKTLSFAGGINDQGTVIPAGGFDPIISLFDSAGAFIDENDDGRIGTVPADPMTGDPFDAFLRSFLTAGSYTVALTQYDNYSFGTTLADGFERTGEPSFTGDDAGMPGTMFLSTSRGGGPTTQRSSFFALDIVAVPDTGSSLMLLALATGAMLAFKFVCRRQGTTWIGYSGSSLAPRAKLITLPVAI